jgi:hypothetical protein
VTPLVASNTGPASLYLGAQVLFRSQDQGKSWTVISGDLTGKTATAKNCDGNPLLSDAKDCGYGSIVTIAPSPRNADEIWVGTDDGLIQRTADSGTHWTNVTPPGIALWAKVSSIDLSARENGVAYAAIDGHRIDYFQPHVLRTRDGGASWQEIDNGLPRDHFVDVVRADPVKPGLLYAGTDNGVYVSFDDGAHWAALQQNLPNAWVTDLLVHGDDLIAATEGRSIWVLDDVAPLREIAGGLPNAPAHLFAPANAVRVHPDNNKDTPLPPETPAGENPPSGAIIDYWLGANTSGPVTLQIVDGNGQVVKTYSSAQPPEHPKADRYFAKAWVTPPEMFSGAPGMHRFVWNLRYERPDSIGYGYSIAAVWGHGTPLEPEGPFALPGKYTVVLEAEGQRYTAPLTVTEDPRVTASAVDLARELALSQKIDAALADATDGYREKAALLKALDAQFPKSAFMDPATRAVVEKLRAKPAAGQPTFEAVARKLARAEGELESADATPTVVQEQLASDAIVSLAGVKKDWAAAKSGPLADLNASLARAGQKPVEISATDLREVDEPDDGEDLP